MDFIYTVKTKATEIASQAVKVSNSAVKQVKSNFELADKKQERDKALIALGTLVYEAYKNNEEPDTEKVAQKCVFIDEINIDIDSIKQTLREVKNLKTCPDCGEEIKADHVFCPKCGAKVD